MTDTSVSCRLIADVATLHEQYVNAQPFPHIAFDDLLDPTLIRQAIAEFPDLDEAEWKNYLHINERKYANMQIDTWGPTLQAMARYFMSPEFVGFIEQLTGITGLFPDPALDGGGLHRSIAGGYLNVHADFTAHHVHRNWHRRVNLLLYLNEDWQPEYAGDLELWTRDMQHCVEKIAPIANRAVLFSTDLDSYHGHPEPLRTPQGVARKSLALYYFTENDHAPVRSTNYRSRPQDGWRKYLISADREALHLYDALKRRLKLSDDGVSKMLGRIGGKDKDKKDDAHHESSAPE
jgi:Rps23 Pro-64 3,4-dihydroxylase Tpa1-like proline 4-hydroxylase